MGEARVIKLRGGTLYKGGEVIQGIPNGAIAIPGIVAQQIRHFASECRATAIYLGPPESGVLQFPALI